MAAIAEKASSGGAYGIADFAAKRAREALSLASAGAALDSSIMC
jgi:hypothetical protein